MKAILNRVQVNLILFALLCLAGAAHAAPVETYGLVFVCDGAKGDAWYDIAKNGFQGQDVLPNARKYFIDEGAWVRNATGVFPTITGAGMPAVLTGCFPGRHDLPSLYFFDRIKKQYPVLYTPIEALDWDSWLSPNVKTIWEHFDGPNDALSMGPALHRGADEHISIVYNVKYKPMTYRGKLKALRRSLQRKVSGGLPARLTVVYNGWFDHMEHGKGVMNPEMLEHYKAVDAQIGESISWFKDVVEERKRAGVDARYYVALVSDHGHQDVRDVQSIDAFIKNTEGAKAVEKVWTELFGQKLKGSVPEDLSKFDLVCAAGEGHALLYFPVTRNGVRVWEERPDYQTLRAFPFRGQILDLPAVAVGQKAVSFVTVKDHKTGEVWVIAAKGEATIERKTENGRTLYRYKVRKNADPLGFADIAAAKPLMDDGFHDGREWQLATIGTEYPDAVVMLYQVFDSTRTADMYLSAAPFVSIGDLVDGAKSASKHGGLTKDEAWATLAFHGTDIPKMEIHTGRNVDMVPTMLTLMGKDYDASKIDGEPLPDLMAAVREARKGALPAGAAESALKALEAHVNSLDSKHGEELYAWSAAFRSLASRAGLPAARVKELRQQVYGVLAARKDEPEAQKIVAGEVPAEFLVRRRPDLPGYAVDGLDKGALEDLANEIADAAIRRVMELLSKAFDAETDPKSEEAKTMLAEVDAQLALVAVMRATGMMKSSPKFTHDTWRSGTNLRYEGMQKGDITAESNKALADFTQIEDSRADHWMKGIFFDYERAKIQAEFGRHIAASIAGTTPNAPKDIAAAVNALPAGQAKDLAGVLLAPSAPVIPTHAPDLNAAPAPLPPDEAAPGTDGRSVLDADTP